MSSPRKIKIAVGGLYGRLGSRVAALAESDERVSLVGGLVREPRHEGASETVAIGIKAAEIMEMADVLIEFTNPQATLAHLDEIKTMGKAAVIGTTGFSSDEARRVGDIAKSMPIVLDANFSLGIAMIRRAINSAVGALGEDFDSGLVELHRRGKKDSPSGTALDLAGLLTDVTGEKPDICSLRLGDIPGEHTVYLTTPYEVIEFGHRVYSRDAFAAGALFAARWAHGQKPGLYRFSNVLEAAHGKHR
ncbi:MAG: 4-hydroxy-tetrahydrodipicolinate reductase [Elusimicrobia bacterium]|nr:4-hydroxy-tetrahydrodipicolinate reductase [Elusimicrobiota bacterium]